ncbi:BRO family protein [Paenibacillus cisolokensis]|uniref:BRO-N domain-containing protein n=1 Tax=Paenibacillus cisolokensis TaxID=1658519 RepID=UPI003D2B2193
MKKTQIFNHQTFGGLPVVVIDGTEWFGATEAAKALGFSNPYTALSNHVDGDDLTDQEVVDTLGRTQQKRFINESGLYSLMFGAAKQGNNPDIQAKAKMFKRWVTSEVLPSIRKTGAYALPGVESDLLHFKKEAYMVEVAASVLRLPESGRLKLLGDFNRQHGLSLPLPGYADEPITKSATELLKKHGVGIQTKAFNSLLLSRGILEEKERPSSKGGTKTYKSLTDTGLAYGKNIISPNSPRETAPHYFPGKFAELLDLVGLGGRHTS